MLIAESYLHLRDVDLPLRELAAIELEIAESAAREFLRRFEPSVEVSVEEGSRKAWARFMTVITLLGAYGGVRSTIEYLEKDGKRAAGWVNEQVPHRLGVPPSNVARKERRAGVPGELKALFDSVQAGIMTPDEAMRRAVVLFKSEPVDLQTWSALEEQLLREFRATASQAPNVPSRGSQQAPKVWAPEHGPEGLPGHGILVKRDPKTGKVSFENY